MILVKNNERRVRLYPRYEDDELEALGYEGEADLYGNGTLVTFSWSPEYGLTEIDPMTYLGLGWEQEYLESICREIYNYNLIEASNETSETY